MSVESAPKTYLQNRLTKCRAKLSELRPVIDAKRKWMPSAHRIVNSSFTTGRDVEQLAKHMNSNTASGKLAELEEVSDVSIRSPNLR